MPIDPTDIRTRHAALARLDPGWRLFGSQVHQYRLNVPLPSAHVEEFERRHDVSLPDEFRCFITQVGNGGAGPFYGLHPFGRNEDGKSWDESPLVGDLSAHFPHQTHWDLPGSFWERDPEIPPGTQPTREWSNANR